MNALASAPTFAVALFLLIVLYKQLGLFPPGARLSDGVNPAGPTGLYVLDGIIQLDFQKSLDGFGTWSFRAYVWRSCRQWQ